MTTTQDHKTPNGRPSDPPLGGSPSPGKFSNRRARRKLLFDTEGSARVMNELGMKFVMAIQDPRAEAYTYEEIFLGYEREFIQRIQRKNEFRSSSRLLLDPGAFRDTYGPEERDLSRCELLSRLRKIFVNPLPYKIHQTHYEEDPDQ